jgi:acetolactate synthase-1/3 small subunit
MQKMECGQGDVSNHLAISEASSTCERIFLFIKRHDIDVIHCQEHTDRDAVSKEMVLVKIAAGPDNRTEILQIVGHYSGKTVDLQEDSLICLLSGNTDKLDAAIRLLSKFEIIETIRTGKVVMARGLTDT